jgi:hypothetical protein
MVSDFVDDSSRMDQSVVGGLAVKKWVMNMRKHT